MHNDAPEAESDRSPMRARLLIRNISWLGLATILTKPLWFVFITAACMRVLGKADYGYMAVAMSLGFICASFVNLGSERYTVRQLVRDPSGGIPLVSQLLSLRIALSIVSMLVCLGIAYALGYRGVRLLGVMAGSVYALAFLATAYLRSVFQAFQDLKTEAITVAAEKLMVVAAGSVALFCFRRPDVTLAGIAIGMLGGLAATYHLATRRFVRATPSAKSLSESLAPLRQMVMIGLAGFFTATYMYIDQVMLGKIMGDAAAGLYGASFRIIEASLFVPVIVSTSALYPQLLWDRQHASRREYHQTLRRGVVVLGVIGITGSGILFMGADLILRLLAADAGFEAAAVTLRVLGTTIPLLFINSLLFSALLGFDDERWIAGALFTLALVNVSANSFMIPSMGIVGAAIATVGCEVLLFGAYVFRMRRMLGAVSDDQWISRG